MQEERSGGRAAPRVRLSAEEYRRRFEWLSSFSDDELREISFCHVEEPLREGETYFDISNPERGLIEGRSGEVAPPGSCLVAQSEVPRQVWEKLVRTAPGGGSEP